MPTMPNALIHETSPYLLQHAHNPVEWQPWGEAAFARAAHVTRMTIVNSRIVVCAMEPRSALAEFDAEGGRYVLRVGCQGVFGMLTRPSGRSTFAVFSEITVASVKPTSHSCRSH